MQVKKAHITLSLSIVSWAASCRITLKEGILIEMCIGVTHRRSILTRRVRFRSSMGCRCFKVLWRWFTKLALVKRITARNSSTRAPSHLAARIIKASTNSSKGNSSAVMDQIRIREADLTSLDHMLKTWESQSCLRRAERRRLHLKIT